MDYKKYNYIEHLQNLYIEILIFNKVKLHSMNNFEYGSALLVYNYVNISFHNFLFKKISLDIILILKQT